MTTRSWATKRFAPEISLPLLWRKEVRQKMQGNGPIEFGAHGRTRTAGLLLTKELLEDHFPIGALLRSNAEAIANNRCLAAFLGNLFDRAEIARKLCW